MHKDGQTRQTLLPPGAHFGQLTQICDFGGLIMAESHYAPGSNTPMHIHETASFTVILRGEYMEEHRVQVFNCFPGKILFRAAGEQHCDRIGYSGAHCVMLEMRPAWQERLAATQLPFSVCQMHDTQDVLLRLRRELTIVDEMTPLAVEALVLELCCQLQRGRVAPTRVAPWLRQVQEKLEAEFAGKQSLRVLAADADVHPAHLARVFRQQFGYSVGEYVRRRRIEFACERIEAGEPLNDIAIQAGFANQPHFSRTFKAVTGLSPGQFRREKCKSGAKNVSRVKDAARPPS
jgi:AraC family transcriptional regulator